LVDVSFTFFTFIVSAFGAALTTVADGTEGIGRSPMPGAKSRPKETTLAPKYAFRQIKREIQQSKQF
jgi:hypothetical protein